MGSGRKSCGEWRSCLRWSGWRSKEKLKLRKLNTEMKTAILDRAFQGEIMSNKPGGSFHFRSVRGGGSLKHSLHLFLALLAVSVPLRAAEFKVTSNTVVALASMDAGRRALG